MPFISIPDWPFPIHQIGITSMGLHLLDNLALGAFSLYVVRTFEIARGVLAGERSETPGDLELRVAEFLLDG